MKWILWISLLSVGMYMVLQGCQGDSFAQGRYIYEVKCSNCHLSTGKGLGKEIPSLHKAVGNPSYWSCLIRNGKMDTLEQGGVTYVRKMPANPDLTAADISNVINFIQHEWVDKSSFVALDSVNQWLEDCPSY